MCGRFENKIREEWMMDKFAKFDIDLVLLSNLYKRSKENIAPTNSILTVVNADDNVTAELDKWGIKFSAKSPLIFNSRIETIASKPFWNRMFDKNRCVVPMTAFYEWKKIKTKKIPHRISLKNDELFFVPALFHIDIEGIKHISLITTEPNEFMKDIHHRMPVILNIEDAITYLTDEAENNFEKCLPYKDSANMQMELADI